MPQAPAAPTGGRAGAAAVAGGQRRRTKAPGLEQHVEGEKRPTRRQAGRGRAAAGRRRRSSTSTAARGRRPSRAGAGAAGRAGGAVGAADGARARRRHQSGAGQRQRRPHLDRRREGARQAAGHRAARRGRRGRRSAEPLPDFSRWGEIERQPMRAVRRKTAEHLSAAWATIPHVTQHDLADITDARGAAEALREAGRSRRRQPDGHGDRREGRRRRAEGVPAVQRVDRPGGRARSSYKKYVNIGVAVDTDRGLLVPVIRDADTKNIIQIVGRARAALREGAHPQDLARRDAGRLLQHLEPRRHRRHASSRRS